MSGMKSNLTTKPKYSKQMRVKQWNGVGWSKQLPTRKNEREMRTWAYSVVAPIDGGAGVLNETLCAERDTMSHSSPGYLGPGSLLPPHLSHRIQGLTRPLALVPSTFLPAPRIDVHRGEEAIGEPGPRRHGVPDGAQPQGPRGGGKGGAVFMLAISTDVLCMTRSQSPRDDFFEPGLPTNLMNSVVQREMSMFQT